MNRSRRPWVCLTTLMVSLGAQQIPSGKEELTRAPRIWSEEKLRDWFTPVAGMNARPNHYSEAEFYAAPVDNLRTYPVYHPDHEPPGYLESLRKRGAQPMLEVGKARSREEWIEAGQRVLDELDVIQVRTSDFRVVEYVRSREALKKYPPRMTKDGQLFDYRWVVDKGGELKLSNRECSSCHTLLTPEGIVAGAQGNPRIAAANCPRGECAVFPPSDDLMFSVFSIPKEAGEAPPSAAEGLYTAFGAPWIKDDVHQRIKSMSTAELQALTEADVSGTFARFNGSPYFTTKIPSLIGVHRSRHLDHTGTHLNRGPEDIARYAALVLLADDGSIGEHKFLTEYQRKLRIRMSDDALYALGMFITYGLKEPDNPNKPNDLSKRGETVFMRTGCPACHTPPDFTNGMLIPVDGFAPPESTAAGLQIMRGVRIGTDPGLALRTRKGTGYYKVPSLVGVWHRRLLEHSGSISSLEDWFDHKRLSDSYIPSGWKGPGVTHRAVPGHEFGIDLSHEDKRALIAFLRTL
jgi:hypothetical protein